MNFGNYYHTERPHLIRTLEDNKIRVTSNLVPAILLVEYSIISGHPAQRHQQK